MLTKKKLFKFLLIAVLVYGIFSLPSTVIDKQYGKFYLSLCDMFFSKIGGTGFTIHTPGTKPFMNNFQIGNRSLVRDDGKTEVITAEFNSRIRGYLPTLLMLALIIASPVIARRKTFAIVSGLALMTSWILFKQWIHLLESIAVRPWIQLYDLSVTQKHWVSFLYNGMVISIGPSFTFAVLVWILVTFRKEDLLMFRLNSIK